MMVKIVSAIFCFALTLPAVAGATAPRSQRPSSSSAGIYQLIEARAGHVSCWGVVIQLGNSRFRRTLTPDQIMVREGKHGHDLRDIMTWRVEMNGRRLVIRFKPGSGDFGSGNTVEVRINRAAFRQPLRSPNDHFIWAIGTDVL